MECPFELPIRLNKRGHFVCGEGKSYRDLTPRLSMLSKNKPYFVQATNSHEKLTKIMQISYEAICTGDQEASDKAIGLIEDYEQALKEAEKQ